MGNRESWQYHDIDEGCHRLCVPCQYEESLIYVRNTDGKVKAAFFDGVQWEATVLLGSFKDLSYSEYFFLVGRFLSIYIAALADIDKRQSNSDVA